MFTGKPLFKSKVKTEIVSVTLPFEDSHFATTLAIKKLYRNIGNHIKIVFHNPRTNSRAYELFCRYPKYFFWMSKFTHTVEVEIGFKDFEINAQAERPENIAFLGISLDKIRSE